MSSSVESIDSAFMSRRDSIDGDQLATRPLTNNENYDSSWVRSEQYIGRDRCGISSLDAALIKPGNLVRYFKFRDLNLNAILVKF